MSENGAVKRTCPACGYESNCSHTLRWDGTWFGLQIKCCKCGAEWRERAWEIWRFGDIGSQLCTVENAACYHGVTARTVRKWLREKKFKSPVYVSGMRWPLLWWQEVKAL